MKKPLYTRRPYHPPLQRILVLETGGVVCTSPNPNTNPNNENIKKDDDEEIEEEDVDTRRFFWDWNS